MRKYKKIPKFKNEDEEREFWAKADLTDYIDPAKMQRVPFPNLKPTLRTISIRLPQYLIEDLKILANERDIPYQVLMKQFLFERVKREWRQHAA